MDMEKHISVPEFRNALTKADEQKLPNKSKVIIQQGQTLIKDQPPDFTNHNQAIND
jgi:hypothetical protein